MLFTQTEMHLESYQIATMAFFRKNTYQLQAVNFFSKNAPSQIFGMVLNMPLSKKYLFGNFKNSYTNDLPQENFY